MKFMRTETIARTREYWQRQQQQGMKITIKEVALDNEYKTQHQMK
jgi:hypothetical protein